MAGKLKNCPECGKLFMDMGARICRDCMDREEELMAVKTRETMFLFYRGKKPTDDILVKCLLNGVEARLPLPSSMYPYYKWSDFRQFYTDRCKANSSKVEN